MARGLYLAAHVQSSNQDLGNRRDGVPRVQRDGRKQRARGLEGRFQDWLGNSKHLWMWYERSLAGRLRRHEFVDIRRAPFGDSEDPRFAEVENLDRFMDALAMQCARPR